MDLFMISLDHIRRHYTGINGVNSDLRTVSYEVPQGSVLGPLFFLL